MELTENKYYLQRVEKIYESQKGYLCYRLIYSNGIITKNIDVPFEKHLKIDIELKL